MDLSVLKVNITHINSSKIKALLVKLFCFTISFEVNALIIIYLIGNTILIDENI